MEIQNSQLIFLTVIVIFLNFISINGISLFLLAFIIYEWINFKIIVNRIESVKLNAFFKNKRALIDENVEFRIEIFGIKKCINFSISIPELGVNKRDKMICPKFARISFFHSYHTRGEKIVSRVFLNYHSPFFRVIRKFDVNAKIFVLPNFEMVRFNKEKILELIPNLSSYLKLLEDPTHIMGIREYNNDPVKKIHWKLSAKYNKLLVKNYEFSSQGKLFVAVFLNLHPEIFSKKAWIPILKKYTEDVITGVAGIIKEAVEKNIPTRLLLDTKDGVKSIYSNDWIDHFDLLAQAYGSTEVYNYEMYEKIENEIQFNDTLLIVSMYLTEKDIPYILRLREKCSKIIVLILPYGFRRYSTKKFKTYFNIPPDILEIYKKALILKENDIFVEIYNENTSFQEGIELVN
ncbi:MAG: hypothetical protein PWP54_880 [Thermosipho sp. (in: thermotogales)]|nr:hypothetical protein [Thermosipho sp. (in: thermotogales)]